ncbi:MAG: hypothetical protein RMI91_08930 [Gemmatales bacterium]|nr:hypothetical protein [Gemmatales bacterium]MDW7994762.1 hypothetical protein [Gemmatales bacterium]
MRSIYDLTTEEAWRIVKEQLHKDVPPLEAVQNEDWGRDYILQELLKEPPETLIHLGLFIPTSAELPNGAQEESHSQP